MRLGPILLILLLCAEARAGAVVRFAYIRSSEASDCPTSSELQADIASRLGYNPFDAAGKSTVIAVVSRQQSELRASVDVIDEQGNSRGHRDIETPDDDCQALARALALSISIAIDPERANAAEAPAAEPTTEPQPSGPSPAAQAGSKPAPMSAPPAAVPGARSLPARRSVSDQRLRAARTHDAGPKPSHSEARLHAGALVLAEAGVLPNPTAGASLFGGVDVDGLKLGMELRALLPAYRDFTGGGRFRSWVVAGGVSPCYVVDTLWLCGVALLGVLRADSFGVERPDGATGVYAALGGRIRFVQPLTRRLGFAAEGDARTTPAPVDVRLDGVSRWKAPVAGGSFALGLVGHFR